MTSGWLPEDDWERIQRQVPVACVDALAVRFDPARPAGPESIGLILRDEPGVGRRWCLIGGRVHYDEAMLDALARHVRSALGDGVQAATISGGQPIFVAQYSPRIRPGFGHDPRKHAIALTFVMTLAGEVKPQGEAFEFRWFPEDSLPSAADFGFGQDVAVSACLEALRVQSRDSWLRPIQFCG